MKRYIHFLFIFLMIYCCASKQTKPLSNSSYPSVLFEFKGIKPKIFRQLEKDISKEFQKKNIIVGFKYNFIVPPFDNQEYLNLPDHHYDSSFDNIFAINLTGITSNRYNSKERQTNIDYHYNIKLIRNIDSLMLLNKSLSINQSTYRNYETRRLAKILMKKYEGVLSIY